MLLLGFCRADSFLPRKKQRGEEDDEDSKGVMHDDGALQICSAPQWRRAAAVPCRTAVLSTTLVCFLQFGASISRVWSLNGSKSKVGGYVRRWLRAVPQWVGRTKALLPHGAGMVPNPRTAFGMVTHRKRAVLFGGILDQEGKVRQGP